MPKNLELSANANNSNIQSPLFANDIATALTKESTENQIKLYFQAVLSLSKLNTPFPINLDDVWPLVYKERCIAVRALKTNFIDGLDYVFDKNVKNPKGGRPLETYMLSIPCLEYFIARKVRPVFEVYRKVFHKAAKTMYTEAEVKKHLTDANKAVKEATERTEQEIRLRQLAEAQARQLKSQVDTLQELFAMEITTKVNMLSFIAEKGLKKEWDTKYGMFL